MKRRVGILLLTSMISISHASADMTVSEFIKLLNGKNRIQALLYINGIGTGYIFANSKQKSESRPMLFCQPNNLALGPEQYINFVQTAVQRAPTLRNESLGMVLLFELADAFPC
ncbi:hypothetical protein [Methylocapsa palsarum]|uniref:hypothetical protein n=1 Tax=Methylocapsa palsarum TaxID=1612308 RepID=UPI0011145DF7|nr:hypothetical protein [Methylocapsa palsarum]